ncbi:MAG: alpha/beta hydrolase [Xanthomonadaceae bacterium]|nr:alpha/beta hydrolase [Xanthomonadaceae bacterium]
MRELMLETPRGRLGVLRHGPSDGVRVLAVHGWLDNAASFVPILPHLPGCDVAAIDLPGHGLSDHRPSGAEYTLAGWVEDVLAALDALGWQHACLLGHSLGGAICSMTAAAAPERVRRLALIEALGVLSGAPETALARLREGIAGRRALAGKQLRVFRDLAAAVRTRMAANALSEPVARLLVERGVAGVEGGYVWRSDPRLTLSSPQRAEEATVRAWLAGIECPTLLIAAAQSQPYFTPELRDARLASVPDIAVTVLPGGHHLHMETPEPVAAQLQAFLCAIIAPGHTDIPVVDQTTT